MLSSAMDSAFEPLRGKVQIIRNDDDVRHGLEALLRLDPRLAPIVAEAGPIPLRLREPGFAGLAHIIVSQMVSRASAEAIWRRMLPVDGSLTAEGYALLHTEAWREFGLSRAKAETLSRIAEAVASGRLDLSGLCLKPPGEALGELTALKGVGPWTAEVYLMFCGGHADVFPAGDVALQNAVGAAFGLAARPQAKALAELSEVWSPWRSVAARLFWAYYATRMRRDIVPIG
ncbi:DNA-3-methyladenine glycosylase family protein [Rhizobium leguminosarum]|uniref:DNA-3-methyladenine glycosylase family protein n=1 Tax=Rhizobium leguminosarum TaxID=384 RepID=UPI0010302611|nr:DNA-3-methyladenine glycosylase [Rhizobium leguminosarum]TAU85496.1 DNA-3-methyladenine glycosylase 2 family protein [Rhizobium leguminosarum]TAV91326.1 DNA-3-methyladenine glycosylase 2 family protein [Rhizobium leguminosarum]TAV96883.1 DNA-3-methyladenine glycosylase 2 family protein [Rhizobium leguminosarum]TAW37011.1 DNA-3-methyladenine glycosylase 2 family protein [Rhizobium leguminosarum]TAX11929.1 DNA-3-methyladenine glycosylase 2 family protein [Rhizobium leguminosarum]